MKNINSLLRLPTWLGLGLVAIIAIISQMISILPITAKLGLSAITIAIIAGMIVGNTVYNKFAQFTHEGVNFAKGSLLRTGIILYGFRITFQQIDAVGIHAIVTDVVMLTTTFFVTLWLGYYCLKIDKQIVYLVAAGSSICGAAAVMATEPVLKAQSHKVAVGVATVVIFGTLAMFLYPHIYQWQNQLLDNRQFGIYIGSTVHEVAQVVAAGRNIDNIVADNAVITKMIRVMMLAPFLVILSMVVTERHHDKKHKIHIPWFAVWFIIVALVNSINWIPENWVKVLVNIDTALLVMAMTALGLTTHIGAIKQAGLKPLLLGLLVFFWLVMGGGLINWAMSEWFF